MNFEDFENYRVTHNGQMHGAVVRIVHSSGYYPLLERLESLGLAVTRVERLGWVTDEGMPKTTQQIQALRWKP